MKTKVICDSRHAVAAALVGVINSVIPARKGKTNQVQAS